MDDADGLDRVALVLLEAGLDRVGVGATVPVGRQRLGLSPSLSAMVRQRTANWPVSTINSSSPGDSVLTRAASHAPVPEEGKMMTGFCGLEQGPHGGQQALAELLEVGAAVIEHLPRHGIEDALRDGRRPRNL